MSKVCVFLVDGVEEIEALTVVDILRRGGVTVETVSITDSKSVTSSHKITIQADRLLSEINFDETAMIVLPGGMPGTKNLEACAPLMEQVDRFHAQGKYLSAICAAPSIFGHKGLLKGRTACCFPDFESHLEGAVVTKESGRGLRSLYHKPRYGHGNRICTCHSGTYAGSGVCGRYCRENRIQTLKQTS